MMVRPITLVCAFTAGLSGLLLYSQKHKTTQLDQYIAKIIYDTQRIKSRTTMLRTEWTLLNQPDRLKDLASHFIPTLQPLQPAQFVQMSAIASVLPPVQKNAQPDKIREELTKAVAISRGQPPLPNDNKEHTPTPTLAADFDHSSISQDIPKASYDDTRTTKQLPQKRILTSTDNNNIFPDIDDQQENISSKKKPIMLSGNKTKSKTFAALVRKNEMIDSKDVKTGNHLKQKKPSSDEIDNDLTHNDTQPQKEYLVKNVSFNINSDKSKFLKPSTESAQKLTTMKDQSNLSTKHVINRKKSKYEDKTRTLSNSSHQLTHEFTRLNRNESSRNQFSESALSNHQETALPAPVPFTR